MCQTQAMDHVFSSHKSRSQCGPHSIFLLSILPFCSSQSKHRLQKLDAVQQFSAAAQAVGNHFLLCSHSSEAVTAEVSMPSHWLNKCPQGISILWCLVHFLCLFIPSCSGDGARISVINDSVLFPESPRAALPLPFLHSPVRHSCE